MQNGSCCFGAVSEFCSLLSSLTTDSSGQLDVLWHNGDTLGVDGAQVGIFEETNQVCLAGFLQSSDSRALEAKIGLEVLGDFTDETLKWELADQKLSRLLVTTDLAESDSTWSVSVWLLDSSGGWCRFTCSLGSKLLSWGFTSC